ncbi:hypothetical protein PENTCL1PPCAC_23097, partial [Pristionchus entomophagus]
FPLLFLPIELIVKIFSFLSLKDRLKLRVNRQLHEIEKDEKWKFHELNVSSQVGEKPPKRKDSVYMTLSNPSSPEIYLDGLKKIVENCLFKVIHINISNSTFIDLFHFVGRIKSTEFRLWIQVNDKDSLMRNDLLTRNGMEGIMEGRSCVAFMNPFMNPIPSLTLQFLIEICEV